MSCSHLWMTFDRLWLADRRTDSECLFDRSLISDQFPSMSQKHLLQTHTGYIIDFCEIQILTRAFHHSCVGRMELIDSINPQINCYQVDYLVERLHLTDFTVKWQQVRGRVLCVRMFVLPKHNESVQRTYRTLYEWSLVQFDDGRSFCV